MTWEKVSLHERQETTRRVSMNKNLFLNAVMSLAVSAGAVGTVWGAADVDFDLQAAIEASQAEVDTYEQELLRAMEMSRLEAEAALPQPLAQDQLDALSIEVNAAVEFQDAAQIQVLLEHLSLLLSTHTITTEQEVEIAILMSVLSLKTDEEEAVQS